MQTRTADQLQQPIFICTPISKYLIIDYLVSSPDLRRREFQDCLKYTEMLF